jgi:UDP-N-acetylmuramoylalanine--D-glutamate ligase
MELAGKRVMMVGLGVSGRAAARFLASRGAALVMTDRRTDLDRAGLPAGELKLGADDPAWVRGVDLVVTSPGVPRDSVLLQAALDARVPVIGELELAARHIDAPIVGITGTNGKSTVTTLVGEMLKAAGMRVFVGGNLGTPLIDALDGGYDAAVVEVSSFQLEWIERFRPHVGVHLNLTDDHFDRYRGLDDYGAAKARLFENQGVGDWAVLNRNDPHIWKLAKSVCSRVIGFGLGKCAPPDSIWPAAGGAALAFEIDSRRGTISLERYKLKGRHNVANAMAAVAAALAMGAAPDAIERALADFAGLPHRVEFVREKDGVTFIDDSKGTNIGAVIEALAAVPAPVILIAGGLDKGGDYAPLKDALRGRVRVVVLIGAAREKMRAALEGAAELEVVQTLADAVARAHKLARRGDTVMLSPACASFDQFRDYAERGNVFKELVRSL